MKLIKLSVASSGLDEGKSSGSDAVYGEDPDLTWATVDERRGKIGCPQLVGVKLGDRNLSTLVDSGCDVSLISHKTLKAWSNSSRTRGIQVCRRKASGFVQMGNASMVRSGDDVIVKFSIRGKGRVLCKYKLAAKVFPCAPWDMILGMDFLTAESFSIDLENMLLRNETIQANLSMQITTEGLGSYRHYKFSPNNVGWDVEDDNFSERTKEDDEHDIEHDQMREKTEPVYLAKSVYLAPETGTLCKVKISSTISPNRDGVQILQSDTFCTESVGVSLEDDQLVSFDKALPGPGYGTPRTSRCGFPLTLGSPG